MTMAAGQVVANVFDRARRGDGLEEAVHVRGVDLLGDAARGELG
jgi:hypothetical protein